MPIFLAAHPYPASVFLYLNLRQKPVKGQCWHVLKVSGDRVIE